MKLQEKVNQFYEKYGYFPSENAIIQFRLECMTDILETIVRNQQFLANQITDLKNKYESSSKTSPSSVR